jgi:sugar transferase (PEP-CTERM system associated)
MSANHALKQILSVATMPAALPVENRRTQSFWRPYVSERRVLLLTGDLVVISVALLLSLWLRSEALRVASSFGYPLRLHWWPVLWALWVPLTITVGCYDLRKASDAARSSITAAACAGAVTLLYLLLPVVSAPLTRSRLAWFIFAYVAVSGVGVWRIIYTRLFHKPGFIRRVLVVGAGESGQALAREIESVARSSGVRLTGFVDDDATLWGKEVAGRPVLAGSDRLLSLVQGLHVDEIVVAITDSARIRPVLFDALVRCWERGVTVVPMPLFLEETIECVPVEHIGQNLFALVGQHSVMGQRLWSLVRRLADMIVGAVGLLLLAPFFPLIALAIYLDSPGPILYRQERVGRGGRLFRLTKFRSMAEDAERDGAVWAQAGDARVTRVGRLMRKARLDELPQLWNLLVGNMTLIGPRPERPEFVGRLEQLLPYYAVRHSVKPGLTGWAQVRYRYGSSVDDALKKLEYDLYYVKHRSPMLDAIILLYTIRVVLQMQGT